MSRLAIVAMAIASLFATAACANPSPVADETSVHTIAAIASGQSICTDLATTHLLILIQAQALIVSEGQHATDDAGWIAELNSDAANAPAQLAAPLYGLTTTLQSIQTGTGVPANDGTIGEVGTIASYCQAHGYPVPATSE